MKRTKIKPVSSKRAKELRLYAKLREKFLSENPMCQVCGNAQADQIHHMKKRGVYLNDVRFFLGVCAICHHRVESNPQWSRDNGYSLDKFI